MRSDAPQGWRFSLALWFFCTAAGLLLIDLDAGPKVVALAMHHGLGVLDAAGVGLILAGWLGPVMTARRPFVMTARPSAVAGAVVGAVGVAVLVGSIFVPDFAGRDVALAGTVLVVQVAVAVAVVASSAPRLPRVL